MNILPFVITILLVLSMFSLSHFRQILSPEADTYLSYFQTLRKARHTLAEETYQTHHKKKDKEKKAMKKRESSPSYFRNRYLGCKEGRLHLFSLINEEQNMPLLNEVAHAYFRALYGHVSHYDDTLLSAIIAKQKEYYAAHREIAPLYKLSFKNPKEQERYYRLIRGTHTYDFETKKGFPPMEDFFTFEDRQTRPMQFNFAPEVFLNVLFSPEFVAEIREEEYAAQKEKRVRKTIFNAGSLLTKAHEKMIPNAHLKVALLDFSPAKAKKILSETDSKTQITVRTKPL